MVQGHIDGVGTVVTPGSDLRIRTPEGLDRYLVEKGSITVDGVSLTCFDVHENSFSVALIPHTLAVTTLGSYSAGDSVNLEVDVIAKYVERLLAPHNGDN
jgi:riboflavin synthase